MGKSTRGQKEYSENQKLKHENQKLRRKVSTLQKQLARLDLSRYNHIKEILQEQIDEHSSEEASTVMGNLRHHWACHKCDDGVLEVIVFARAGQTCYLRECDTCSNRTKTKPYHENVKGIFREKKEETSKR